MTRLADVLICTEASPAIGHGHVMRCLALADEARRRGMHVRFSPRDPYAAGLLREAGETGFAGSDQAARFVIRDYRDGSPREEVEDQRARGSTVLLLDELGPARTVADAVCDAFMTEERARPLPHGEGTRYLYGLAYAPLHGRFREVHAAAEPGRGERTRLFVSFGGAGAAAVTLRFVKALNRAGFRGPATVVTGGSPEETERVRGVLGGWEDTVTLGRVREMVRKMAPCDLVATKMGVTVLEAFCLGLGCLLLEPSPAHVRLQEALAAAYAGWPAVELGLEETADCPAAARRTRTLLADRPALGRMGARGADLVDGRGAERIVGALLSLEP